MSIDTSKLNRYKPGYVHSNDGPGYISMLAREDGEYVRLEDVLASVEKTAPEPLAQGEDTGKIPWPESEMDEEDYHVIMTMGRLLASIAVILKGPEPAGTAWSYHDLPKIVRELKSPQHSPCKPAAWVQTASLSRLRDGWSTTCYGEAWAERNDKSAFTPLYASPQPAAEGLSDGMLPDALVPHAKEWYRLCERRFSVERMTISGELAEAIVEAICAKPVTPNPPQPSASVGERARELEQAQRLAVSLWERNYKESSPDWKVDETLTGVLLQISNMVSGMSPRSNADNRFADLVVSLRDRAKWSRGGRFTSPHDSKGTSRLLDMAADAIEQALTQQRGEAAASGEGVG